MFTSTNGFTQSELVSLSNEFVKLGTTATPVTDILLNAGTEKAQSTVHSWIERTLNSEDNVTVAEGSETTTFQQTAKRELSNVLQIMKKAAHVSGTAQALGKGDLFSQEITDRLTELKVNLEKALINGQINDGSNGQPRAMKGLFQFAEHELIGFNGEKTIKDASKALYNSDLDQTGTIYLVVNYEMKESLDQLYADKYYYQHKETNFGVIVSTVNTNAGVVNIVVSKHVPDGQLLMFNDAYTRLVYLREPQFEALAKSGDSIKGHVLLEATLAVTSPKAVVKILSEAPKGE